MCILEHFTFYAINQKIKIKMLFISTATGDEIEIAAGVEWGNVLNEIKREEKNLLNLNCTFKYSGVAGSARVEPGVHVNYRCWCRWMWWLSSLSLLYTPLLSRAGAVLLRAFWVHGCALVHSFIIRYQITMRKNDNKCSLKLDLDPIQWETRSTGGCRWLSPSYPSIVSL